MNRATCKDCKFFEPIGDRCRRNAPLPYRDEIFADWPIVLPESDWCGEFGRNVKVGI